VRVLIARSTGRSLGPPTRACGFADTVTVKMTMDPGEERRDEIPLYCRGCSLSCFACGGSCLLRPENRRARLGLNAWPAPPTLHIRPVGKQATPGAPAEAHGRGGRGAGCGNPGPIITGRDLLLSHRVVHVIRGWSRGGGGGRGRRGLSGAAEDGPLTSLVPLPPPPPRDASTRSSREKKRSAPHVLAHVAPGRRNTWTARSAQPAGHLRRAYQLGQFEALGALGDFTCDYPAVMPRGRLVDPADRAAEKHRLRSGLSAQLAATVPKLVIGWPWTGRSVGERGSFLRRLVRTLRGAAPRAAGRDHQPLERNQLVRRTTSRSPSAPNQCVAAGKRDVGERQDRVVGGDRVRGTRGSGTTVTPGAGQIPPGKPFFACANRVRFGPPAQDGPGKETRSRPTLLRT